MFYHKTVQKLSEYSADCEREEIYRKVGVIFMLSKKPMSSFS